MTATDVCFVISVLGGVGGAGFVLWAMSHIARSRDYE